VTFRARTLLYHDVIVGTNPDKSGFSGASPAEYKIPVSEFERHLDAVADHLESEVILPDNILTTGHSKAPVLFSFDDGGVSSFETIAPMLESRGWRGCFFITTDRIETPAFVSREQICELHDRGHAIGSHSCSHPRKISECSKEQLLYEWGHSLSVLSDILTKPVTIASVPGGFYSKYIAQAAAESGVKMLFTSEPVQRINNVSGCAVVGRFSVKRGNGVNIPVDFIRGKRGRVFRQYAYWNLKKVAKAVSGPVYPWVRSTYLSKKTTKE
jgi:peptidoglycan/xylan/chitin deacetylase (PgdA/CDA1 family)